MNFSATLTMKDLIHVLRRWTHYVTETVEADEKNMAGLKKNLPVARRKVRKNKGIS